MMLGGISPFELAGISSGARFTNVEVYDNLDGVVEAIAMALEGELPCIPPS